MKSSYQPFLLWEDEKDAVTIVRLAPSMTGVQLQVLSEDREFEVCIFDGEAMVKNIKTNQTHISIDGLEANREYTILVKSESGESRRRLFVTGDYLGTVVNYLHPEDTSYAFSGRYIATPSLVRFKGDLYVSMDVFHSGDQRGAYNLTLLYRSKDDGKTWEYVTDIVPAFWGTLFTAKDKLCILAVDSEVGSLVVMSSEDGQNWSDPTYLIYGCGSSAGHGVHKSATPYLERDGKLYFVLEYGGYGSKRFDTFVASVDLSMDVCAKDAWTFSGKSRVEFDWWEGSDQTIRYAIEGNMVEKDGRLYVFSRYAYHRALVWQYDPDQPLQAPVFQKVLEFEAGHCKFFIRKNEDSTYDAMGNHSCYPRHILRLYHSKDLENWELVKNLEDISHLSPDQDGVQYPSFIRENGKFYTVLRNALNGAKNFHDSNAIVFKIYE